MMRKDKERGTRGKRCWQGSGTVSARCTCVDGALGVVVHCLFSLMSVDQ